MKDLWQAFKCWAFGHNWTSAADEGIKPTEAQLKGGVGGFMNYATMYCKDCPKVYKP